MHSYCSLGPIGAPEGAQGQVLVVPNVRVFFQAVLGMSEKRRTVSFGYVVDMDKISNRFLTERDPTTG